jgi:hypothetical protein
MSNPVVPTIQATTSGMYANAYWGMPTGVYSAGIITRVTRDTDGEVAYLYDNNGYTVTQILFDDKSTFTVELVLDSVTNLSPPARGTLVTIDGVANCIVQKLGREYVQKDWRKGTFTAMNFVNLSPT